jgi:hypothetical protein
MIDINFPKTFGNRVYDGDYIDIHLTDELVARAIIVSDDFFNENPWDWSDGHGPVSDWRRTDSKQPGERILCSDGGQSLFYDFAAAVKQAREEGWDAKPYHDAFPDETPGQQAERAAEHDYDYLLQWCRGDWGYVGVKMQILKVDVDGKEEMLDDHAESLWGLECGYPGDDYSYLTETANELLHQYLAENLKLKITKSVPTEVFV